MSRFESHDEADGQSGGGLQTVAGNQANDSSMIDLLDEIQLKPTKRLKEDLTGIFKKLSTPMPRPTNASGIDMSEQDFDNLAPSLPIGQRGYTREMEFEFERQWASHPNRLHIQKAVEHQAAGERLYSTEKHSPLWKTCGFILRCWPTRIITLDHYLAYEADTASDDLLWNRQFCESMVRMILNDRSRQHAPTIRAYLQYAVICRTNDTSLWPLQNFEDNNFLARMIEAIGQGTVPRRPIPVIHRELVKERYGPGSQWRRPASSLVFEQIENLLYREATPPVQQTGRVCYKVRNSDLRCILQAFDNTEVSCHKPILNAEALANWFSRGRYQIKSPPSDLALILALKKSVEYEIKLAILYKSQHKAGGTSTGPAISTSGPSQRPRATSSLVVQTSPRRADSPGRLESTFQTNAGEILRAETSRAGEYMEETPRAETHGPVCPRFEDLVPHQVETEEYQKILTALPPRRPSRSNRMTEDEIRASSLWRLPLQR